MKTSCHSLQHNPNKSNNYSTIKPSVNCLKNNKVSGFHNIMLIQSKRQPPNLKKLAKEYGEVLSVRLHCNDKGCECCNYLLMNEHYAFQITNVQITFKLKNRFTCDSFKLRYVFIYDTCKEEYIGEVREGKTKLRDRVSVSTRHSATTLPTTKSQRTFKSMW